MVRRTFSPARAWRPAVVARLARTLGGMNCGSASPSSASAVGLGAGTVSALWQQEVAATSRSIAFGAIGNICSAVPSPASVGALRHQEGFLCAHVLRRSREPVAVTRSANSMRVAPVLLQPHAGRRRGLSSTHPVRLARRFAKAVVSGLGQQGRIRTRAQPAPARSRPELPPNMSVNRSANGWPPCPRSARCLSCASRARRPSVAARLPLR